MANPFNCPADIYRKQCTGQAPSGKETYSKHYWPILMPVPEIFSHVNIHWGEDADETANTLDNTPAQKYKTTGKL